MISASQFLCDDWDWTDQGRDWTDQERDWTDQERDWTDEQGDWTDQEGDWTESVSGTDSVPETGLMVSEIWRD